MTPINRRRQKGMTLTEVLVATAIFAMIFLAALMVYDRSQKTFKIGVESTNMQQETRVGFTRLVQDIRMAGFDFDRDGRPFGSSTITWTASTPYGRGSLVSPPTPNGLRYQCTTAGTSGAFEPPWSTTAGDLITDNTVIWRALSGTALYQQPDEQIEMAGAAAITIRANFDFESDKASDNGREFAYEPELGQFPLITTGNDEIVTYVLKSDRGANADSVSFYADTRKQRKGYPGGEDERLVTIAGVDTCTTAGAWNGCREPPYTLYRVSLEDTDLATVLPGNLTWTPIASHIRSLRFTYFEDISATTPVTDVAATPVEVPNGGAIGGSGQWTAASPTAIIANRLIRQKIKSIKIEYVGMNEVPDLAYSYPGETLVYTDTAGQSVDVRQYRQFRLESIISPRNINKHGLQEQATLPPGNPKLTKICFGHCGLVYLEWEAPDPDPTKGNPETYNIVYDTVSTGQTYSWGAGSGTSTLLPLPSGFPISTTFYFRVEAVNGYGTAISAVTTPDPDRFSGPAINTTDSGPPTAIDASELADGIANRIDLRWTRPLLNKSSTDSLACIETSTTSTLPTTEIPYSEVAGWRVFRSKTTGFTPDIATNMIWSESSTPAAAAPLIDPITGGTTFSDKTAVNCVDYYYVVQAVERCVSSAAFNSPADTNLSLSDLSGETHGYADTVVAPATPDSLTIDVVASSCTLLGGCTVALSWPTVLLDAAGDATTPAYRLERVRHRDSDDAVLSTTYIDVDPPAASATTVTYTDTGIPRFSFVDGLLYYKYRVAASHCALDSAYIPNPGLTYPCQFPATILLTTDAVPTALDGDGTSGSPWVVTDASGIAFTSTAPVDVTGNLYRDADSTLIATFTPATGITSTTFGVTLTDGVRYRAEFFVTDPVTGCVEFLSRYIEESPTNCCLTPGNFDPSVLTTTSTHWIVNLKNSCSEALTIQPNGVQFTWTRRGTGPSAARPDITSFVWPAASGTFTETLGTPISASCASYTSPCIRSVPVSGTTTIPANGTYSLQINVSGTIDSRSTIDKFCVNYQGSDATNVYCRILPSPGSTPTTACD